MGWIRRVSDWLQLGGGDDTKKAREMVMSITRASKSVHPFFSKRHDVTETNLTGFGLSSQLYLRRS
jgi:hypothetical protein